MNRFEKIKTHPIKLKRHTWYLIIAWSVIVFASLIWNVYQERQEILAVALASAHVRYQKDVIYRRWNAEHGGVYVPVTEKTLPNPHLDVPERDIRTPSGRLLTLMNPAYMNRKVYELEEREYGIRDHLTSLNPIRSENAPDPWETQALQAFQRGAKEVSSLEKIDGKGYMRLMHPLHTEKACLQCHAGQGYKVGDIRGGISVSLPMAPLLVIERSHRLVFTLGHGLLWLIGLVGIGFGAHRMRQQVNKRYRAEETLRESEQELRIRNRIAEIFLTVTDNEMYGEVLQVVLEAMESPYGTFAYINEDGDRIVPSMTRDIWDECKMHDKGIFFPRDKWDDTLWAKCLIEKKSFFSNGPFTVPDGHIPITRAMATPIIYQRESIGNLIVGDKPTDYSEKDKKLLETIADRIAPILHSRLLNERHEENRKLAEKQIKTSLQEKEVLLREIHHRVKNNMQVISSLLKLQANTVKDERIMDALMESEGRVQAMASVHETLYGSDNLASIDFQPYISNLTKTMFQSYGMSSSQVESKIEAEDIEFGIEQAAPLGLLINELVSNALKHAFPENRKGEIIIRLQKTDEDEIELVVGDNGIGIPEDRDWGHTDTLGFKLVTILAENQLNGTVNLNRNSGTRFTIRFKLKEIG